LMIPAVPPLTKSSPILSAGLVTEFPVKNSFSLNLLRSEFSSVHPKPLKIDLSVFFRCTFA
jgi:hypothetical protein